MNVFDYGNITDAHKEAIQEVINLVNDMGNGALAELLKYKFQIAEPNRVDFKETEFYKICNDNDIKVWVMGYVQDNGNDPSSPHYPILSITEDYRKLEKLIENIRKS